MRNRRRLVSLPDAGNQHGRISKEFAINYRRCSSAMDTYSLMANTGHKSIIDG